MELEFWTKMLGVGGLGSVVVGMWRYRRRNAQSPTVREFKNEESITTAVQALKRAVQDISVAVTSLMKINELVMEHDIKIDGLRKDCLRHTEELRDVRREASEVDDRVRSLERRKN